MTVTAIFGVHWGDEGKGKVVDASVKDYDVVARWNGGNNAGHTIVTDEYGKVAMHLVPSGILYKGKINIIGNGEVVNLQSLLDEINTLRKNGVEVTPNRLVMSERSHLILPYYRDIEKKKERTRNIGTTGQGVGETYALQRDRTGVRVIDLLDKDRFIERIKIHAEETGLQLDPEKIFEQQRALLGQLKQYLKVEDTVDFFERNNGANILLEGAQGFLLDIDAGTYPYVTSSNPSPAGAYTGCLGVPRINRAIGIMKAAYITRVGGGPFPTELGKEELTTREGEEQLTQDDLEKARNNNASAIAKYLRIKGGEYGTTTGRPRRTGWQDLVATKYVLSTVKRMLPDVSLALTKLDVTDGLLQTEVCTNYRIDGTETTRFPSDVRSLSASEPLYKKFDGWDATRGATKYNKLPDSAQSFIRFLEDSLQVPISMVSTGPNRKEIILL